MNPSEKILKAKIKLQKKSPFFAYLVMNLKIVEKKEVGSMGVDNKGNCYYNPSFVEGLTNEEVEGVLCHEVMHIVLEHLVRGQNEEYPVLLNVAMDMCINDLLLENDFAYKFPKRIRPTLIPKLSASYMTDEFTPITVLYSIMAILDSIALSVILTLINVFKTFVCSLLTFSCG